MNVNVKRILSIFLLGILAGACVAKTRSVTRGPYPFLKLRNSTLFSDGETDRLRVLAWHPTEQMFVVAGGPRSSLPEVKLINVFGDATGARMEDGVGITIGSGYTVKTAAWSPDGTFLAFGGSGVTSDQVKVYSYARPWLTAQTTSTWSSSTTASVNGVAWHPSSDYLAVVGSDQTNGYELIIYAFDSVVPLLTAVARLSLGTSATGYSVAWSNTGNYLAIGCGGDSTGVAALQVYQLSFTGTFPSITFTLTQKSAVNFGGTSANVKAVAWSADDKYLAAGGFAGTNDNELKVYSHASGILTLLPDAVVDFGKSASGAYVDALAWDPLGAYLIAGGYAQIDSREFIMYSFDGARLTPKRGSQNSYGTNDSTVVTALAWQPTRQYVAVGGYLPSNSKELWLMEFLTSKPLN
jgi:WD40 repeat protein